MTIDEIERLVRHHADARERLGSVVDEVRAIQRQATRERMRAIRDRAARVSTTHDRVRDAIDDNRALFAKPRTQSAHGIKFGLRKSPGRIEGDQAKAIERIERRMPERTAELVRTKKSLDLKAVGKLDARELGKLGLTLAESDDQIVIAAASTDLDKLVEAMLEEEEA